MRRLDVSLFRHSKWTVGKWADFLAKPFHLNQCGVERDPFPMLIKDQRERERLMFDDVSNSAQEDGISDPIPEIWTQMFSVVEREHQTSTALESPHNAWRDSATAEVLDSEY